MLSRACHMLVRFAYLLACIAAVGLVLAGLISRLGLFHGHFTYHKLHLLDFVSLFFLGAAALALVKGLRDRLRGDRAQQAA
jgi:hypothetical protein